MRKGEKRDFPVKFPDDYHSDDIKGAEVRFFVELLEIKEKNKPDLTDEVAKNMGYESQDDMRKKIQDRLKYQKRRHSDEKLNKEILDKLIEENQFDLPQVLVEQQKEFLKNDVKNSLKSRGFKDGQFDEYFEKWGQDIEKKAIHQVRSGLILEAIAREDNIEVTDEVINEKYKEIAHQSNMPVDEVKGYYENKEDLAKNLRAALREEVIFKKICEKVSVVEKD